MSPASIHSVVFEALSVLDLQFHFGGDNLELGRSTGGALALSFYAEGSIGLITKH